MSEGDPVVRAAPRGSGEPGGPDDLAGHAGHAYTGSAGEAGPPGDVRPSETAGPPGHAGPSGDADSLRALLGGRRGAVDAALPGLAFAVGWLIADRTPLTEEAIAVGTVVAIVTGTSIAGWRLRRGDAPRAVVIGLLGVCVAAVVALRTGRAEDFFLVQLLSNAASALAWAASIVIRRPLLGVVVGTLLGQRFRWRRDRALLRAYGVASWVWVAQYLVRVAVFVPLWYSGQVVALAAARAALSWPLIAACLGLSWWVLRRALPADHPGLRHPLVTPVP